MIDTSQWGVYSVANRYFTSKLEAIQYQRTVKQPLTWNYQEQAFAKWDWTKEPTDSLWELYSRRAHALRQQYDYICLLYSGGADSENVLSAFERNGIMVDEIRIGYAGDCTKATSTKVWSNLELYHVAIPRARALQKKWPKLTITVIDMNELMLKSLDNYTDDNLHFKHNMSWSIWQRQRFGATAEHRNTWSHNMRTAKQVAILWGKDKTFVNNVNGRYAVQFVDRHLNGSLVDLPDNARHEYFYWSPDAAEILIKQGHVIKNFYRMADVVSSWHSDHAKFVQVNKNWRWHYNTTKVGNRLTSINNACYNTLVYPFYDPTIYDVGKLEWQTLSQSMKIMLKSHPNYKSNFDSYIDQCSNFYGSDWATGVDRIAYGPDGVSSKAWFLE